MLIKVISGGQTGADQAGLKAAKLAGYQTGGWLPNGCITLNGPRVDLLKEYSMREHVKSGYPIRTEANVKDSDATIRFATSFSSAGEKCTLKAIKWYGRPYIDIDLKKPLDKKFVAEWIIENGVEILNVAGNSEQTSPGIEKFVVEYLSDVLNLIKEKESK